MILYVAGGWGYCYWEYRRTSSPQTAGMVLHQRGRVKGFHSRNLLVVEREMVSHSPSCPRFPILYSQERNIGKQELSFGKERKVKLGRRSRWWCRSKPREPVGFAAVQPAWSRLALVSCEQVFTGGSNNCGSPGEKNRTGELGERVLFVCLLTYLLPN